MVKAESTFVHPLFLEMPKPNTRQRSPPAGYTLAWKGSQLSDLRKRLPTLSRPVDSGLSIYYGN